MLNKQKERVYRFVMRLEYALDLMEILLSIIVVIAFVICLVPLVRNLPNLAYGESANNFRTYLVELLDLVIGIEFVKMLIKHTPSAVLEVMLFALARHMVVTETTVLEGLLTVIAISGIFAIRRFIYVHSFESTKDASAIEWLEPVNITPGWHNKVQMEEEKKQQEKEQERLKAEKENLKAEKEALKAEKESFEAEKESFQAETESLKAEKEVLEDKIILEKMAEANKTE